jgi:hypothetical protein
MDLDKKSEKGLLDKPLLDMQDVQTQAKQLKDQLKKNEKRILKLIAENSMIKSKLNSTEETYKYTDLDVARLLQNSFC